MMFENFKEIMKYLIILFLEFGNGCYSMCNGVCEELMFDVVFIFWVLRLKVFDLKFMNLNVVGYC